MALLRPAAHLPPTSTRARIGLFGGSFDPPHGGHLHVAETALKRLNLDQIWWFPTPGNPLKEDPSDYEARLGAVRILTQNNRAFEVSNIEKQAHLRYTIDLVRLLRKHCPHAKLTWIMGGDSLTNFHRWKDWKSLAHQVPIAVIARPGSERSALVSPFAKAFQQSRLSHRAARMLPGHETPAWIYLPAPLNPVSSTAIRNAQS